MLCIYVYGRITLLLSMSTAGISLASLYNIDKALVVDTSCVPEIQPLSGCNPSYDTVGSFAIASAKVQVDKKSIDIGIDAIDGTPGASQVVVGNDHPKSN